VVKIIEKVIKASREIPSEMGRFVDGKYPSFVADGSLTSLDNEVPVFMFHTADAVALKQQLEYLKTNDYQTLDLKTFMAFLKGDIQLEKPSVLLTFDDGEKSWYEVAYPLLKQYGFNAAGFVVPSYIQAERQEKQGTKTWLSWAELVEMDQSGIIEIESHSYFHARVFVEPKLVDFFNPQSADSLGLDVPWICDRGNEVNQLELGTPIFRYAPRLVGQPRYFDSPDVREACVAWVKSQGDAAFFERPNWRKQLAHHFHSVQETVSSEAYESADQTRQQMLNDLVKAKDVLSERLNKSVNHLCYPWGVGSQLAVQLSQEAGYISNFWVTLDQRNTNRSGDSPFYIPRLKDDYLLRLPGEGRHSLLKIFQGKLQRRSQTLEIY
jgi:peptidoglycan/xylan/chitin deacetylase (PgdA/CDA1 family)